jgi:hypothetical protein
MKEERQKLQLRKRTIANLSNLEMFNVYGGDGDEDDGGVSRKNCGTTDDKDLKEVAKEATKLFLTQLNFC